ncbi:unnamed protein product [Anisakis simplex]|nr:unnamed protein product [Anisakis simplex]
MKPTCKRCYDRFPNELKKRISDSLKDRDLEIERNRVLQRRSMSPTAAAATSTHSSGGTLKKS